MLDLYNFRCVCELCTAPSISKDFEYFMLTLQDFVLSYQGAVPGDLYRMLLGLTQHHAGIGMQGLEPSEVEQSSAPAIHSNTCVLIYCWCKNQGSKEERSRFTYRRKRKKK